VSGGGTNIDREGSVRLTGSGIGALIKRDRHRSEMFYPIPFNHSTSASYSDERIPGPRNAPEGQFGFRSCHVWTSFFSGSAEMILPMCAKSVGRVGRRVRRAKIGARKGQCKALTVDVSAEELVRISRVRAHLDEREGTMCQ
jgi:hypothetical protein